MNDCANTTLQHYHRGSPIMADDINEVEDITDICSALVINIGILNERTIESMIKAGKRANKLKHPIILDPVDAGGSKLRNQTVMTLLKELNFAAINCRSKVINFFIINSEKVMLRNLPIKKAPFEK